MASRTVRVFQDAIFDLADDPSDEISNILEDLAEQVREAALVNIDRIFKGRMNDDSILQVEAGKDTKGIFFTIHLDGRSRWSRYLARKQTREQGWFKDAVVEVFGLANVRTLA